MAGAGAGDRAARSPTATTTTPNEVAAGLRAAGLRAEPDLRSESMGKKIAEAEHQRIPCILVVGDREVEAGTVSLRRRDQGNLGARPLAELRDELSPRPPRAGSNTVPGTVTVT